MYPSLNFDVIRSDIERAKQSQIKFRVIAFAIPLLLLLGLLALIILVPPPQADDSVCLPCDEGSIPTYTYSPATDLLPVIAPVAIFCFLLVAAPQISFHIYFARQINRFAPAFIPRMNILNILSGTWPFWLSLLAICLGFAIGIVLEQIAVLLFAVTVAFPIFLPRILNNQYQRFLQSRLEGGLGEIERWLQKWPSNADLMLLKALCLMEQDQLQEAETLYRQLLERKWRWTFLNIPQILDNLGLCLNHQKRFDEAVTLFDVARRINPEWGNTYAALAYCYLEQNLYPEETLELATLALTHTYVNFIDLRTTQQAIIAHAEANLGKAPEAKTNLANVKWCINNYKLRPAQVAELNRQMGYTYLRMGDVMSARGHFRQAIKLDPNGLAGRLTNQALEHLLN